MYTGSDRMFYFAGENVLQDFNQTAPPANPQRPSIKDTSYYDSFGGSPTKSVQIRDPEFDILESPKKNTYKKETSKLPPRDLGEEFAQILLDEFKRVRQINTKDPKVLLEFWKQNRRTRQKENDAVNRSMRASSRGDKSFISQGSQTSDRVKDLQKIAQEREEDVVYTLDIHSQIFQQEDNIKKFFVDQYRMKRMEEELKKKQKPKKMSKETLDRLYKPPVPKAERPSSAHSTRARTTMNSTGMKVEYDRDFVERLVEEFGAARPTEKRYVDAERLFAFWQTMPNKHDKVMNKKEAVVKEDIQKYFDEKYDNIQDCHDSKYGYKTYDAKVLANFHKTEISEAEKARKGIDYDSTTLEKPLEGYCARRKKEREEFEKQNQLEAKLKRIEEEKAKLSKTVIKKDIKATDLETLSKPKDNLQKGKTMLFLKKMFPNDRILQRMILNEFKKNKLLKYPEEYDVYDSDDEIDIRQRDEPKEPFKTAAKEGRLLKLSDFNKAIYTREKEVTTPFQKYLEQKYFTMNLKIEDDKHTKTKEQREDKQLDRFIGSRVRGYLQMRKKRLYEKTPSLKEFLIKTYKEMRSTYKNATDRRFPHITYGYSKRLKVNSYPVEFKRHFFLLVKAISRGTKMSKGKSLLPFWAPPSAGSKAMFLDTNKSYNRRVTDLSKENKIKRIEGDYNKTSCWEKEEFFLSRLSIMMTLSDAKECTFAPSVGSKMPNKHKELMQQEYGAWANQVLNTTKASFDEWVNAMGTNLSRKFPAIYKYGRFKKAIRYWKEEQYIRSYKEIAEAFNIDQIKKYFNPSYDPHRNQSVMFGKDNIKLENDGPRAQEDFGDQVNAKFLEDVYVLIMFLESQEKELKKSISEVKSRLVQDKIRRSTRRTAHLPGTKTIMCPLGEDCSEDIRPRWPASSVKTISRFGQKCEFAHHAFELRFKQEVNAKKKMLNSTLDVLNKKLNSDFQRPPFNPGGNVFNDCIGCGEELRTKGVSKGICSSCQLKKSVNKNLQMYRQKAAIKYLKITQKESFKENYAERQESVSRVNTKLGYYRKACVLYENQRYRDAFTFIAKAVEIVKTEKEEDEEKEQKKSDLLKTQLGIDQSVTITLDMLYDTDKNAGQETSRSNESLYGLSRAKLIAYAEKMGYIGEQKVNVNEFLNYQIQTIYLKIEKALQSKQKDISLLQKKIEKLEGFDEEVEEKAALEKAQAESGFKSLSQLRREQEALKQKNKFDIDLVNTEKKIENLQKTVKYIQHEIEESTPPEPWRPTKMNNIILDIERYDQMMSEKKTTDAPGKKPKDISEVARNSKGLEKSIYNRDLEDLIKLPNERASPMKY